MVENQCASFSMSGGIHEWLKISVSLSRCPEVLVNGTCLLLGVLRNSSMVRVSYLVS